MHIIVNNYILLYLLINALLIVYYMSVSKHDCDNVRDDQNNKQSHVYNAEPKLSLLNR